MSSSMPNLRTRVTNSAVFGRSSKSPAQQAVINFTYSSCSSFVFSLSLFPATVSYSGISGLKCCPVT